MLKHDLAYMALDVWKTKALDDDVPEDAVLVKDTYQGDDIKVLASKRQVKLVISTGAVDRDNDTIDPKGWDLGNYKKNPVVLWAHRYFDLPIGVAVNIRKEENRLMATDQFVDRDVYPLADTIYQLLTSDPPILRTSSVGFRRRKHVFNEERGGFDFLAQELLEHSIVPVPSNPEALVEARSILGHDVLMPYKTWCERVLDEWHGEEGIWIPRSKIERAFFAASGHHAQSVPELQIKHDDDADETDDAFDTEELPETPEESIVNTVDDEAASDEEPEAEPVAVEDVSDMSDVNHLFASQEDHHHHKDPSQSLADLDPEMLAHVLRQSLGDLVKEAFRAEKTGITGRLD